MGSYSFKSSGVTQATNPANNIATTPIPIGIVTPLALGDADLLKTNSDLATQIADNFRNMLQTNWGERVGLYDFGANLRPLLVDLATQDDFDAQAIDRIRTATQRWMPYIDLVDFLSSFDKAGKLTQGIAQATITITYDIPTLGMKNKKVKATLYAI